MTVLSLVIIFAAHVIFLKGAKEIMVDVFDFWPKWLAIVVLIPPMSLVTIVIFLVLVVVMLILRFYFIIKVAMFGGKDPFE